MPPSWSYLNVQQEPSGGIGVLLSDEQARVGVVLREWLCLLFIR